MHERGGRVRAMAMAMAAGWEGSSSSSSWSSGRDSLLQELPDDVLALISGAMQHRDLCNLSSTCRKLRSLCTSDKLWLPHCERLVPRDVVDLHAWRSAMPSFKALCRFLYGVKPLVGIWVHQNPELGNMVYVTWGFVSVVGCRIIPQELGPKGLDTGLLWAPVFEIIGNSDGSFAFFLHGRDRDRDFCYPGRFKPSREDPNVLLLEAEPLVRGAGAGSSGAAKPCSPTSPDSPLAVPPLADHSDDSGDGDDYSSTAAFRNGNGRAAASSSSSSKVGKSSSCCSTSCRRCCRLAAGDGAGNNNNHFIFVHWCGDHHGTGAEVVPFNRLAFGDRRRLLEHLAPHVGLSMPDSARGPLFLGRRLELSSDLDAQAYKDARRKDLLLLAERRLLLLWMYSHGDPCAMEPESGSQCEGVDSESLLRALCGPGERDMLPSSSSSSCAKASSSSSSSIKGKGGGAGGGLCSGSSVVGASICPAAAGAAAASSSCHGSSSSSKGTARKLGFAKFVRSKMKQIIGKNYHYVAGQEDASGRGGSGSTGSGGCSTGSSNADKKRLQLQEFLRQGTSVGLRLHATSWKLSFYRAWPIMHDNRFALYKMPEQKAEAGREHAGLWGGTFGWPPGRPADDKPGKALFFLLLSYDQTDEGRLLIATKILEGTHYVLHPNGSAMFTAKMEEPSAEPFPWERLRDGHWAETVESYQGEGISNGYGFRYPGSKPGDLFVDARGTLAFVWRESKAVLTLQRLDLQALLEQGERVAALPAVANFAYLTKSYSNVFAGYCGPTSLGTITLRSRADGHVRRS